jgi:hypothetical protein
MMPASPQQVLGRHGQPEVAPVVPGRTGAARAGQVEPDADEQDRDQGGGEAPDVDDAGGGTEPAGRVEGTGEVEADHRARAPGGQGEYQDQQQP